MNLDRLLFAVADWLTPSSDTSPRWELKNRLLRLTGLNVGEHTAISRGFICYNASQIVIERYVAIGQNAHFFNFGTLRIGEFATLAQNVSVVNGWHATEDLEPRSGSTSVGRGAWIGLGAKLVGSISLGDLCIVGAGSVVVHDVPDRAIVVGVPARVIGYREVAPRQWHFRQIYFDPETFSVIPAVEIVEGSNA